ncbi:MAG: nuclear transport factor 2 family protein [Terriglobia bacterium]
MGQDKVQEEFAAIDRKWLSAEKNGEWDFCEKFFADSYILNLPDGQALTKREWLDLLEGPNHPTLDVLTSDDIHAWVFGDVAIVIDRVTIKGHDAQGQSMDGHYRVLRVLVKRQGEWKAGGVIMNIGG